MAEEVASRGLPLTAEQGLCYRSIVEVGDLQQTAARHRIRNRLDVEHEDVQAGPPRGQRPGRRGPPSQRPGHLSVHLARPTGDGGRVSGIFTTKPRPAALSGPK